MQFSRKWKKRFRVLTLTLIISLTINAGFTAVYILQKIQVKKTAKAFEVKTLMINSEKDAQVGLADCLHTLSNLSFRELVCLLNSKENIEEGYLLRDVALACLIKFYHFNLGKALTEPLQKRKVLFSKEGEYQQEILFFPALTDYQYDAIVHYAYTEKWPLTTKGLFSLLHKWEGVPDESLLLAFYHTKEFEWFESLFSRYQIKIEPKDLLYTLLENTFSCLVNFYHQNKEMNELTRRKFLLEYIFCKSSNACHLLLQTDFLFAVKKLDDPTILLILTQVKNFTEDVEQFCFELIKSSRSDAIWEKSAEILYAIAKETLPHPYDHKQTVKRFVISEALKEKWGEKRTEEPLSQTLFGNKTRLYTIKEGDTLWKIARRHKIDIDQLIETNHLTSDRIHPGHQILIPE